MVVLLYFGEKRSRICFDERDCLFLEDSLLNALQLSVSALTGIYIYKIPHPVSLHSSLKYAKIPFENLTLIKDAFKRRLQIENRYVDKHQAFDEKAAFLDVRQPQTPSSSGAF